MQDNRSIKALWRVWMLARYWPLVLLGSAMLVVQGALTIALPYSIKQFFDTLVRSRSAGVLVWWCLALVGIPCAMFIVNLAVGVTYGSLINRLTLRVRKLLYEQWYDIPEERRNRLDGGGLIARLSNDVGVVTAYVGKTLPRAAIAGLTFCGLVVYLATLNLPLTGVCIVIGAVLSALTVRFGKPLVLTNAWMRASLDEMTEKVHGTLKHVGYIKARKTEHHERGAFVAVLRKVMAADLSHVVATVRFSSYSTLVLLLGTVSVTIVGGMFYTWWGLTLGGLIAFLTSFGQMVTPLGAVVGSILHSKRVRVSRERVESVLDMANGDTWRRRSKSVNVIGYVKLEARGVTFAYPEQAPVLKNVCLHVRQQEMIAVTGASGSGKSTLLRVLANVARPSHGDVVVWSNGGEAQQPSRQHVAYLPQELAIFAQTVEYNLAYGTTRAEQASPAYEGRRTALISQLGLQDLLDALPNGIRTVLEAGACRLSAGQRQRLCLASVLLREVPCLILDEPTTGLDPMSRDQVVSILREARRRGRSIILSTHDAKLLGHCDRVYSLKGGMLDVNVARVPCNAI